MNPITIEISGPKSRLVGYLPDDVVRYLRDQLSYKVKGAYFSQQFQEGHWDGRKFLMTEKRHEFATGLVSRVVQALQVIGYEPTLVDTQPMTDASHFLPLRSELKLFDYQQHAVDQALYYRNGILRIATGGGKTIVGIKLICELERPAIFLVHRLDLLHQVKDVLCGVNGNPGLLIYPELVGQVGGGVYEPNLITIMTVQTACAALGIASPKEKNDDEHEEAPREKVPHKAEGLVRDCLLGAEVFVLDEAHHAPASTIYEILMHMRNARWRIGLSATDWRDDGADLYIEAATGPRLVNVTLSDLIAWKRLVPARIKMHDIAMPHATGDGWGNSTSNWQALYAKGIVHNDNLNQKVLEINEQWYNQGRTILTLVRAIKHGVLLKKLHRDRSIDTVFLSGSDTAEYRKMVLEKVRSGNLRHLIATSIADEGLDLPALDALNLAGGGKSSTNAYQRIGRIIRTYDTKSEGLVADYTVHDRGLLAKHAGQRKRIYQAEKGFILE